MQLYGNTLALIKSIGIQGLIEGEPTPPNKVFTLLQLAKLNKTPLLYLESVRKNSGHLPLETQFSQYSGRYQKTLDLTATVSNLLEKNIIHHTIFKTLKPFPYIPSDVDIIIWSSRDLTKASNILKKENFKTIDADLYGLTMLSINHNLNVDLTTQIAVSGFIYMDKKLLSKHTRQVEINGFKVQTLKPHAELVATAAHCMYKEQMYTLSDYYTFALSSEYYRETSELAENAHAEFALDIALKLTYDITISAFGLDNSLTIRLADALQKTNKNGKILQSKRFDLPIKYPPSIVLKSLSKKLAEDPISKKSLPTALRSIIQPKSVNKLLNHITRKGY